MGLSYKMVLWNGQKKAYDKWIGLGMAMYLVIFLGLSFLLNPEITAETVIIRAFGTLAMILLHIILAIGPMTRISAHFMPLLYNRRHLGVSMFLAALVHGGFSTVQFHVPGNINPIKSLFTSNMAYGSLTDFPFQTLGFLALLILFVMASTSHDFFLHNLSAKVWKRLHMMVYMAYALIIVHVFLGAFQQEALPWTTGMVLMGFFGIVALHLWAAFKESKMDGFRGAKEGDGWLKVCHVDEIAETRAKVFSIGEERAAIFKHGGKLSAVHNVCKHQGGPLGEGKIVDGCITCPWHGYQYLPHNGQSPPPFTEKIKTYELKVKDKMVYINTNAFEEGTEVLPISYSNEG